MAGMRHDYLHVHSPGGVFGVILFRRAVILWPQVGLPTKSNRARIEISLHIVRHALPSKRSERRLQCYNIVSVSNANTIIIIKTIIMMIMIIQITIYRHMQHALFTV